MEEKLAVINEYNWAYWIAGAFAVIELIRWIYSCKDFILEKVGIRTKGMLKNEEDEKRLKKVETDIDEIKKNSDRNVAMFLEHEQAVVGRFTGIRDEIISEIIKLHEKIDEQKTEMDATNEANIKTDCAMLRDRIASGMRYFGQNKDENGVVHISFSDHENMEALFQEYFAKHGNGTFHHMYEHEFQHFVVDM